MAFCGFLSVPLQFIGVLQTDWFNKLLFRVYLTWFLWEGPGFRLCIEKSFCIETANGLSFKLLLLGARGLEVGPNENLSTYLKFGWTANDLDKSCQSNSDRIKDWTNSGRCHLQASWGETPLKTKKAGISECFLVFFWVWSCLTDCWNGEILFWFLNK